MCIYVEHGLSSTNIEHFESFAKPAASKSTILYCSPCLNAA